MRFTRTTNFNLVRSVLTCPEIYKQMGDDFIPAIEMFQPNRHPDIVYVLATQDGRPGATYIPPSNLIGLFSMFPQNRICWELHVAIVPGATKYDRRIAGRLLAPWLADNTICKRLTAAVPELNKQAIAYGTHVIGMHIVGRQEKAFMRDGHLQDLVLMGMPILSGNGGERCPLS